MSGEFVQVSGNGGDGIRIGAHAVNTTVWGDAGIYGNGANGIAVLGTGTVIRGSYGLQIGQTSRTTPRPNQGFGIFVDGATTQGFISNFANNSTGLVLERNLFYWTAPEARLFSVGALSQDVIHIDNNLYYAGGGDVLLGSGESFAKWQERGFDTHSVIDDPLFVNPKADDYSLKPGSPALKLGFEPIDASKIGLLTKRELALEPVGGGR